VQNFVAWPRWRGDGRADAPVRHSYIDGVGYGVIQSILDGGMSTSG